MARWIAVAKTDELAVGSGMYVEADDVVLSLFNHKGEFFALDGACPHQGAPLADGYVDSEGVVTCPWHSWQFCVKDGISPLSSALRVRSYPVRVEDGVVQVDVEEEAQASAGG